MNYRMIIDNSNAGIAIMVDKNGKFTAYVNGKHYSPFNYRPIDGNGRQLREDSQRVISEMMPEAKSRYEAMEAEKAARLEVLRLEMLEDARKEATPKPRSFAEVLEESFIKTLTEKSAADMVSAMYPTVEKMLVDKFGLIPQIHTISVPNRPTYTTNAVLHKEFDTMLHILMDNDDGRKRNALYLCGAAGTGKSFIAKQLADALNVEYHYSNCITDDVQLKGFIDANGRYHETEFYKAFVNGGVFFFDEMDGSVTEALLQVNDALANGRFPFPCGAADAHKEFYCVAAGNTYGTGGDNEYTGRSVLDAATLNRFSYIDIDYDEAIERSMCGNDSELVEFAHDFRNAVKMCGVSCLCTYRDIERLHKFTSYMDKPKALKISTIKGLAADDVRMIYNKLANQSNSWAKALKTLSLM